ncbi:MAG: membrane protein insertion efficiency factor YidD [Ignavibacteriales bacterium]|nr:membrane protein insertion efficiency factor YidD [Ignavibacteriales bacterium]
MKLLLIYIFLLLQSFLIAQSDWKKWEAEEISYQRTDSHQSRDYSFGFENISDFSVKVFTNSYWFFISEVDGDNCPYSPSCSSFFMASVKETNTAQGLLMFFDRFTRDFNIFNRKSHYPHFIDGQYFDPPSLYTLEESKIKYTPPVLLTSDK